MAETNGHGGLPDYMTMNRWAELQTGVTNATSQLIDRMSRRAFDPRRNIEDECGYPRLGQDIPPELYQELFERDAIAKRVCEVIPNAVWQVTPEVYESEDSDDWTPFEQSWDAMVRGLRGEMSWHQDGKGSALWEYLRRLDVQSGIGSFGLLLLGFDDGLPLSMPLGGIEEIAGAPLLNSRWDERPATVEKIRGGAEFTPTDKEPFKFTVNALAFAPSSADLYGLPEDARQRDELKERARSKGPPKLTHLRVYPEHLVQIIQYETNSSNPRFGMPVRYQITLADPRNSRGGLGYPMASVYVHWSRVIHVPSADLSSSEFVGAPQMRCVLNNILGLRKMYGGSPEGYWKMCMAILSLETHPQLGGDVDVNRSDLRDMMENLQNGLQRSLVSSGMSLKSVFPNVVDPGQHIDKQIEAICIVKECPVRVFKGSERGELASSQDDSQWNDKTRMHQNGWRTPRLIVPLADRLIACGVLAQPGDGGERRVANAAARGFLIENVPGGRLIVNAKTKQPVGQVADGGYSVDWPDLDSLAKKDKASIMTQFAQACSTYIQGGVEALVPPKEFLTTGSFGLLTEKEADNILASVMEVMEEKNAQPEEPVAGQEAPAIGQGISMVLTQVAQGMMTREAALWILTELYKVPPEDAEEMAPQPQEQAPEDQKPDPAAAASAQGAVAGITGLLQQAQSGALAPEAVRFLLTDYYQVPEEDVDKLLAPTPGEEGQPPPGWEEIPTKDDAGVPEGWEEIPTKDDAGAESDEIERIRKGTETRDAGGVEEIPTEDAGVPEGREEIPTEDAGAGKTTAQAMADGTADPDIVSVLSGKIPE